MPDFLIVGAMKAGTTTLYYDLGGHPDLHLPEGKEPEILLKYDSADEVREAFAHNFRGARPGQFCGEASTAYTKRPIHEGVAAKARQIIGPQLKIVYIRRDPVERALSQYRHERQHGDVFESFDEAVRNHSRYVDFGRYDWQIAPWKDAFGAINVFELDLEDYVEHRRERLDELLRFIGAEPARLAEFDPDRKANTAKEQKAIPSPLLRALILSDFYQYFIKGLFPRGLREWARRMILPRPLYDDIQVSEATRRYITEAATSDAEPYPDSGS